MNKKLCHRDAEAQRRIFYFSAPCLRLSVAIQLPEQ